VSTPTRIPANVPVRQLLIAGVALALLVTTALPAGAAEETTASLRAKRDVLVQRIAALTDEAERAEIRATDAERRRVMSEVAAAEARKRFAAHAVGAYLDGVQDSEEEQLRRRAWGDSLAETDRRVLGELRTAQASADKQGKVSKAALADAQRARTELEGMRVQLERTIADRVTYERALARNAAKARQLVAGSSTSRVPRHQRATMSQYDLMRTYRFGPVGGVPDGLVATGQVLQGKASWYGPGFDGRATASGAIFDQEGWTVAHRTLPLGTILLISRDGRAVVALVNDRGPFVGGRILDLSHGVANALGTVHAGVASVRAEVLVPA
jgi:rare lipoprotein A (peptidoglycan hydrolase)